MRKHNAFKTRMLAQMLQIRKYRKIMKKQGRKLSINEAAIEWINRYAADFPSLESHQ